MTYTPDPEAFAEVAYQIAPDRVWVAKVYKSHRGWELKFGGIPAGHFQNPKALVKYVRKKALEKVGSDQPLFDPIYDSLAKLAKRSAQSLVPDCYVKVEGSDSMGKGLPACVACPYRSSCGEPSPTLQTEQTQEAEEVFRARLQAKLKAQWGQS